MSKETDPRRELEVSFFVTCQNTGRTKSFPQYLPPILFAGCDLIFCMTAETMVHDLIATHDAFGGGLDIFH